MTEQQKYPTAYSNFGSYRNPQYVLGTEDNLCASKATALLGNYYLLVKTYGFNIPSDATITGVFMAAKGRWFFSVGGILYFYIIPPLTVWNHNVYITLDNVLAPPGGDRCAQSVMSPEVDLTNIGYGDWVPNDFNNETFETDFWWRYDGGVTADCQLDAAYLRVTYTEAGGARGDGLSWVLSMLKHKEVKRRILIQTLRRSELPLLQY